MRALFSGVSNVSSPVLLKGVVFILDLLCEEVSTGLPIAQQADECRVRDLRYLQNRYVRPALKNTISLDGGDCCKNAPVMKPATFNAARKCSLMAQRISRLGWLPTYRALLRFAGRSGTFPKV